MVRRVELVAGAALTVLVAAGCTQTVVGTAERAQPAVLDADRSYGYVNDRCGLLDDDTVRETLGADRVARPYSGAVCQYVLADGGATLDAALSWFASGDLARERSVAEHRGAQITDTVVDRHDGFLARRDTTGVGCAATVAAGAGVLTWWVQFRDVHSGDPCPAAEKLLSATLSADM